MGESYVGNAYCVKCKELREFEGTVKTSDSGRRMAMGKCPVCGTKVNRILGKEDQHSTKGSLVTKKKSEEQELRDHGYMTPGEFVDKLTPGLKEYLKHNWGLKPDDLCHPEDLFSNASVYLEVGRHIAGDFIVIPKED